MGKRQREEEGRECLKREERWDREERWEREERWWRDEDMIEMEERQEE